MLPRFSSRTMVKGVLAAAAATACLAGSALADPPDLSWNTIDCGAAQTSRAGTIYLSGTVGQADVGEMTGDGGITMSGGFWVDAPETPRDCPADWDGNGVVEPADIALFVNTWLADLDNMTLNADIDLSGTIDPADIATFVNLWLNALSNPC